MIGRRKDTPASGGANAGQKPRPPRRKRRTGRGLLWLIVLMLLGSAMLRLADGTGRAIAAGVASTADIGTSPQPAAQCETSADIAEALALLQEREGQVAGRESALADRMQALAVAEDQVATHMAQLKQAEASLKATMALASTAAEDDLVRLTTVYESMKAKDAAPLFAAMDPQFAAGFLGRMRPDSAAAVMALLDPQTAYTISVLLAGRNAKVPTQ